MYTDRVKFIEESHQYFIGDDIELVSVSQFTDKFKPHVDWDVIAEKVAKKKTRSGELTSKEDILKKWERKRKLSAEIGTLYHSQREDELLSSDNVELDGSIYSVCKPSYSDGLKWSIDINKLKDNTIYPELMIYNTEYGICGQSDKVIINKGKIDIIDYKSDQEIKFKAYSSKWVKPEKLLEPISHLDNCNGNIYSIKMSIYMYLLWKANGGKLKPGDLILEHVELERDEDDDNIPILKDGKPVVKNIKQIKIPYRKREVIDMFSKSIK